MKKNLLIGIAMLAVSAFPIRANSAPPPEVNTSNDVGACWWITSCGKMFWAPGSDAFGSQEMFERYLLDMNSSLCGTTDMPETGTRPPTTEPDPGALGVKPGEKKK